MLTIHLVLGHSYLFLCWRPRQESNLYLSLRRTLFYPLNYGDAMGWILAEPEGFPKLMPNY